MLITIGAFDGFHKGHAELLRICRENAQDDNWGVVTFHPHPSVFMGKIHPLFTLKEKILIRRFLNIPHMYVLKFDEALMRMSPAEFWKLLRLRFNVDGLVVGSDFRFGYGRSGSAEGLREMAFSDGVKRVIIADVVRKPEYSSSKIRQNIIDGNVEEAAKSLGYPYFIMSRVIHGDERGRTMNYPTANLDVSCGRLIPSYGVYSCAVLTGGEWRCGALSIGNNPTFGDVHGTRAEVHILDFDGDIYGQEVITVILGYVRGIMRFSGMDELSSQIADDIMKCRRIYTEAVTKECTRKFMERSKEATKC